MPTLGRINASRIIWPNVGTFSGFRKNRLASFSRGGQSWPAHCQTMIYRLGQSAFRSGRRFRGAIERRPDRQFPAACALNLVYPQSPGSAPDSAFGIPSNALPASGRLHAAGCNMASVCTRAGKFILAKFVTIVGPSRSICSPSASKELLRRGPCQGPYQSSPISGEPSGYQSSGPNVGGGASQRIGPKPASNSSRRDVANYHRRSRSVSSQTFPTKWPLTIILHCPVRKGPSCRGKGTVRRNRAFHQHGTAASSRAVSKRR